MPQQLPGQPLQRVCRMLTAPAAWVNCPVDVDTAADSEAAAFQYGFLIAGPALSYVKASIVVRFHPDTATRRKVMAEYGASSVVSLRLESGRSREPRVLWTQAADATNCQVDKLYRLLRMIATIPGSSMAKLRHWSTKFKEAFGVSGIISCSRRARSRLVGSRSRLAGR